MVAVAVVALLIPGSKALLDRWRDRHLRTVVVTAKAELLNSRLFPGGVRRFDLSKPAEKRSFEMIENALQRRDVPYRVERGGR